MWPFLIPIQKRSFIGIVSSSVARSDILLERAQFMSESASGSECKDQSHASIKWRGHHGGCNWESLDSDPRNLRMHCKPAEASRRMPSGQAHWYPGTVLMQMCEQPLSSVSAHSLWSAQTNHTHFVCFLKVLQGYKAPVVCKQDNLASLLWKEQPLKCLNKWSLLKTVNIGCTVFQYNEHPWDTYILASKGDTR